MDVSGYTPSCRRQAVSAGEIQFRSFEWEEGLRRLQPLGRPLTGRGARKSESCDQFGQIVAHHICCNLMVLTNMLKQQELFARGC